MAAPYMIEDLKTALEALPQVEAVNEIKIEENIVKYLSISTKAIGKVTAQKLDAHDAPALFEFYFRGLSEKSRRLFVPYPLFNTPPRSADELALRITDWKKEDDWTALNLVKDELIIGFCLLKRFSTDQVTSGIAIRDNFLKMGLGYLLQNIIIGQARLLNIKRFHVKVVSDNLASVRLHEKCGFKQTGVLPSTIYSDMFSYLNECDRADGGEAKERYLIEMVIELGSDKKDG